MAQYDPQRSRSRQREGEDEGPAPVDALLGPTGASGNGSRGEPDGDAEPERVETTSSAAAREHRGAVVVDVGPVSASGLPDTSRRVTVVRLTILVGAVLGVAALVRWWRRRGRTDL